MFSRSIDSCACSKDKSLFSCMCGCWRLFSYVGFFLAGGLLMIWGCCVWFHVDMHTLLKCPFLWLLHFAFFRTKMEVFQWERRYASTVWIALFRISLLLWVSLLFLSLGALFEASRCLLLLTMIAILGLDAHVGHSSGRFVPFSQKKGIPIEVHEKTADCPMWWCVFLRTLEYQQIQAKIQFLRAFTVKLDTLCVSRCCSNWNLEIK